MSKDNDATILHDSPEPPAYLAARILRRIEKEERRKAFRQMVVSGAFLAASFASFVASLFDLGAKLSQSGFLSFASLFGSDFSFAMANLHELALSLEESFPAMSAAFCIASVVLAVWFGARLMSEAGVIRRNRFATQ
jgi:ABC-type antimicrobial peptide transport system permease subunit